MSVTAAPVLAPANVPATIETTVTNNGPYRDEEVLADVDLSGLPSTIASAVSPAGPCSLAAPPTVVCELDGLDPGASATITIAFTPTIEGAWSVAAEVDDFANVDPVPANDAVSIPITIGGSTSVGSTVVVDTGGATPTATITFDAVTVAGTTSVTTSATAPTLPVGYQIGDPPAYYDIETTASYAGSVTICISDAGIDPVPTNLFHYQGGGWHDITTLVDSADQRICGSTSSLSPFALVTRTTSAPGAPTAATATAGNAAVTVSWSPPVDDGGSPITGYVVTATPGGEMANVGSGATSALVTGLSNGTSYTFTVAASNAVGSGPASLPSNAVTPAVPRNQTITFAAISAKTMVQSPLTVSPSASSGLPVTLTATTPSVCTVTGFVITFVSAGSCSLTAAQGGNAGYNAALPVTRTFAISRVNQTITFPTIPGKTLAQSPLVVTATASSGLPVVLASTTPSVCGSGGTNGTTITLLTIGTCSLTATQAGNATYNPASAVTRTFMVTQATQTITFPTISAKTMLQSPLTLSPTASSGLPVSLTSTTAPVCTVSAFAVTFVAAGSCSLAASQGGNDIYMAAPSITRTFTIGQVTQTVTFANPGTQTLAGSPLSVSASASSSLPVVFTTSTPSICTAGGPSGSSVALLATGSCTVTAGQAGNAVYKAASQARTFSVTQASQTISFAALPTASVRQSPLTVAATASSGLAVSFTTSSGAVCTAGGTNGATITLLKTGTCRVVASQSGNTVYKPAPTMAQSFPVVTGTQTITFGPLADRSVSQPPETLTATATSGLPVTFVASPAATCTLGGSNGTVLTLQAPGTCMVTASQAGNATYLPATPVTQSFTVTATGFVQATGAALTLNGQPFQIFGASIYETSNHGATADPDQTFALVAQAHLNTLRLIDIFDEDGTDPNAPYDAADWAREDALIARAQAAGLHVVVDFSDFRNWWVMRQEVLHDQQVPSDDWVTACRVYALGAVDFPTLDPYSVAARPDWTAFMTYVANRVNTVTGMPYRNDPTILVVSMAGEPWGAGSSECGEATSQQELTDFYAWALGEWKSLDANHLRSNGGLTGTYNGLDTNGDPIPSGQQIDGVGIFALADNTLPSLHTYPPAGTTNDGQTPVMGAEAQRLGKPWFTEEFGWAQGVGDATRASDYQWLYDEQGTYGSAGSLFWNLGPQVDPGTFDTNASTPLTWQVVLDHAPGP